MLTVTEDTHTLTHTHARTHARTHAHTHTGLDAILAAGALAYLAW